MSSLLVRLLGVLLMLTALAVALSRAPDRPVQTLVARWALAPSDFVEVRGQTVHLRDEGPRHDPLPIVLLHGTASSLHTWEGWVRALRGQRRIITLDLPGFGLTGPFTGQYPGSDYRGDSLARFVLDLLDTLKLQRVVLGGHSMGGEVAWRTALLAPQRVASLVLVDASGLPHAAPTEPLGFALARLPVLNQIGQWLLPRALVAQGLSLAYGEPQALHADQVDRYFELLMRDGNRHALALHLQQAAAIEDPGRLAAIQVSTLILWGSRDRLIAPDVGRQWQQRIAGSQLVVLDGLGHMPQEEDPTRSVAPVKAFLGLR